MDIRIGNDIRIDVSVSELGEYTTDKIIRTIGKFIKVGSANKEAFPGVFCSSEYIIHGNDRPMYNVLPNNKCIRNIHNHCHGLCVYEDINSPVIINDEYISSYFPAHFQKECGKYIFVLEVEIKDAAWDNGVRTFTISCDNLFNLTCDGLNGSRVIRIDKTKTPDVYIDTLSDQLIKDMNDNYIQFMLSSYQCNISDIPKGGVKIYIDQSERLVVLSKYGTLSIRYNDFLFPMKVTKLKNNFYVYTSINTYTKNELNIVLSIENDEQYEIEEDTKDDYLFIVKDHILTISNVSVKDGVLLTNNVKDYLSNINNTLVWNI